MYQQRKALFQALAAELNAKVILYVTGDRGGGMETQIAPDQLPPFVEHLDAMGLPNEHIALVIYSRGGDTLAAWSIVNLLRQFADTLTVVVPLHAHSSATLISLGANAIVMTKQATLGPIDPSVNGPLNPAVPGRPEQVRAPVSVEAVAAYFDLARHIAGLEGDEQANAQVMMKLVDAVHPLALGAVYRARTQIQHLARKLLDTHYGGSAQEKDRIIATLCGDAGSHDYSIYRREARDVLKLPIVVPSAAQYAVIKAIYDDFEAELRLREALNPDAVLGSTANASYDCPRILIESAEGGSFSWRTHLTFTRTGPGIQARAIDRWNHESP